MKRHILTIFMVLLASTVFAKTETASLNATGYEWLGYDKDQKTAFAGLVYAIYGVDKNRNKPVDLIKNLDSYYYGAIKEAQADPLHVDEDEFLKIRCVDVITKGLKNRDSR